jgi:ubiquinone/menaquinone biosynthesis C-methylase UbiE
MNDETIDARRRFFDSIATAWDTWEELAVVAEKLDRRLKKFGVGVDERIMDVGCGTGNLTAAILRQLSPRGRVVAVDLSPGMLAVARAKNPDPRVEWRCGIAEAISFEASSFDRILCFSVWPHIYNPESAAISFLRILKPNGLLHIWHIISRDQVNHVHSSASDAVCKDVLAPATETSALLMRAGFRIVEWIDDDAGYLVSARKEAGV